MYSLVGNTGFVGSNIVSKYKFDCLYNSQNIQVGFGSNPDFLVYAGIRAEKYLANRNPDLDFAAVKNAIENIRKINPKQIVLISTIDVYKQPFGVDEDTVVHTDGLPPYGLHRYYLEQWVTTNIKKHLIIRLPGLYGKNIKKNFIFDMISFIPMLLNEAKYCELVKKSKLVQKYYYLEKNGFYKCKFLTLKEKTKLKNELIKIGFSALNFTDSRGIFQFYNLDFLWEHINTAMKSNMKILNLAPEPVKISELYQFIYHTEFKNEIGTNIPHYDYRTKYDTIFGGENGYIFKKRFVMRNIRDFMEEYK